MRNRFLQFVIAFLVYLAIFVVMDAVLMNMQGLSLVFRG